MSKKRTGVIRSVHGCPRVRSARCVPPPGPLRPDPTGSAEPVPQNGAAMGSSREPLTYLKEDIMSSALKITRINQASRNVRELSLIGPAHRAILVLRVAR